MIKFGSPDDFVITHRDGNTYELTYRGPKPNNDFEASVISVMKWSKIHNFMCENPDAYIREGGIMTCGFCMLHYNNKCAKCPVALAAGDIKCRKTPYDDYANTATSAGERRDAAFNEWLFLHKIQNNLMHSTKVSMSYKVDEIKTQENVTEQTIEKIAQKLQCEFSLTYKAWQKPRWVLHILKSPSVNLMFNAERLDLLLPSVLEYLDEHNV